MTWCEQLTHPIRPPQWRGPATQHLKLSAEDFSAIKDEADEYKPPAEKMCTKCRRLLPLTKHYFFVNRREKTGFMCECKECHKARDREAAQRRYHEKKAAGGAA